MQVVKIVEGQMYKQVGVSSSQASARQDKPVGNRFTLLATTWPDLVIQNQRCRMTKNSVP